MQESPHIAILTNLLCKNFRFIIVFADVCSLGVNIVGRGTTSDFLIPPFLWICEACHTDIDRLP